MNQIAPKASRTAMRFGAGLEASMGLDGTRVSDAEVSITIWVGSFSTGIHLPTRIDNHERSDDSTNRMMGRQFTGCHFGHAGAILAGRFVENLGRRTYARVL